MTCSECLPVCSLFVILFLTLFLWLFVIVTMCVCLIFVCLTSPTGLCVCPFKSSPLHIHSLIPPVPVCLLSSLSFLCPVAPHLSFSPVSLSLSLFLPVCVSAVTLLVYVGCHPSGLHVCCHPSDLCLLSPFWSTCLLSPFPSVCLSSPFWTVPAVTSPIYMSVVTLPVCVSAVTFLVCFCCDPSDLHVCCQPSRLYVCCNPSWLLSPFPATCLKSPFWSEINCSISALEAWMRAELIMQLNLVMHVEHDF